ncbi:MAG: UDP-3-O-acyl-N-acetylglucosamine deacetylase [Holosporaceae bacterium]|nr:MAG: UDP-3-O-acyl-N-acetylglucosamine deacetylase [Holosporaceae bacterium]
MIVFSSYIEDREKIMVVLQRTLKESVLFEGVGVHSGKDVTVEVLPAPAGHGIKFQRTDIEKNPTIPALWSYVTDTKLCTKISGSNANIGTIEHLVAALAAQKVDNALIKISGAEVPIMDGSAKPFIEKISDVGTLAQTAPRKFLVIKKTVKVSNGSSWAQIKPHENTFSVRYMFKNRFNNVLEIFDTEDAIADFSNLAAARTF